MAIWTGTGMERTEIYEKVGYDKATSEKELWDPQNAQKMFHIYNII